MTALLFVCALGVAVQTSTPGYNSVLARAILRGEIEVPDMHEMPLRMTDHDLAAKTTWGVLVDSADFGGLLARHRPSALKDNLPGLLLLGLALLGATLGRAPLRWTLAAVLFLALSTGPQLIFNGTPWPSPLGWLYDAIPALSAVRPVRFLLAACLALSVVAAHGLPRLATPGANVLLTIGLLALGALEVWVVHVAHYRISLSSAVVPSFYTSLRARPPTEAVIDVPFLPATIQTGQALYFQTVHVHPMLNYDFVRPASMSGLAAMGRSNSVIRLLLTGRGAPDRAGIEALAGMGFRHLVLHAEVATTAFDPDRVTLFKAAVFDALRAAYGEPTAYADGILVFSLAVPARPLASFRSEVLLGPRTVVRESESVLASIPKGATEVRVWVRGRGARLAAYRRGREVAVGAPTGDGWHWQRLKLPTEGGPMEVRLILPPDLPGALIEDLSAWRPEANG
ncbi:MAG: hypothetical protein FJX76_22495 [Armatimonadetes bacterium]|nr:hypothetical protein [Armatimonadota bacterium]